MVGIIREEISCGIARGKVDGFQGKKALLLSSAVICLLCPEEGKSKILPQYNKHGVVLKFQSFGCD